MARAANCAFKDGTGVCVNNLGENIIERLHRRVERFVELQNCASNFVAAFFAYFYVIWKLKRANTRNY